MSASSHNLSAIARPQQDQQNPLGIGKEPSLGRVELLTRLTGCLEFALTFIESTRELDRCQTPGIDRTRIQTVLRDKIVAETAVLALCASAAAAAHSNIADLVAAIAKAIIPLARSSDVVSALCLDPGNSYEHAVSHVILTHLGFPDSYIDELLGQCLRDTRGSGPERMPHRILEQQWLARLNGDTTILDRHEESVLLCSMLGRPLDALRSSRMDVYGFTHAVMYASDFGLRRPRLPRPAAAVLADAETALAVALHMADWDLSAEALLAWPMLGLSWSSSATFAFELLIQVQREDRFLPGRSFDRSHYDRLRQDEKLQYLYTTSYHATYVMGMLCAVMLREQQSPLVGKPVQKKYGKANIALCKLIRSCAKPQRWLAEMDALLPATRWDSLAPLLLVIILREASAEADLSTVRCALEIAVEHKLATLPVAVQAASLLARASRIRV